MMKQAVVLLVALALALPAAGWAQGKTDFSGTWIFDPAKSDPSPAGRGAGGGGGGVAGSRAAVTTAAVAALSTLYIKQTAAELTIENEATYRLDGRESMNRLLNANGQSKTNASWDGARLVLASTLSLSSTEGKFDIETKEVWSLDARVLTIERTSTTPEGTRTRKLVYNRYNKAS